MFKASFYETYYFCNIIRNVLHDQFSFLVKLNEFYGDEAIFYLVDSFEKYSTFHLFIEFIVEDIYYEEASKVTFNSSSKISLTHPKILPIERALRFHSIDHLSFEDFILASDKELIDIDEDYVYEYMAELRLNGEYDKLVQQTVKEVFHILFQNRQLMLVFNNMIAGAMELQKDDSPPEEKANLFARPSVLKRKSIPKWAQRAVYYRDRGRCVLCNKDLSGTVNLENLENYDHIVPLAKSGLNDVSNIQLLCKECNQLEKKDKLVITSNKYQSWYAYDEI